MLSKNAFDSDWGELYIFVLSCKAQGTLKAESAGVVAGLASKAARLKQGTGADDQPVVVVEFDTG